MTHVDRISDAAAEGAKLLSCDLPMEAQAALRAAIVAGDRRPSTMLNLAIAEDKCGNVATARQRLDLIEARWPDWDEPPLRIAESFRRSGEWPAAERAYNRVLMLNPARIEALVALGATLVVQGRAAEALPFLVRACALPDAGFEAWHALGAALLVSGDPVAAEEALSEASRAAPDRLDIALHRAEAAFAAGTAEAEIARLEHVAEASPLDPLPLRVLAYLLKSLGRPSDSLDMLEVAAEIAPLDAGCAAAFGLSLAEMSRTSDAERILRHAMQLDPDRQQTRADLAAVLIRLLRFPEAETLLRDLIDERGEEGMMLSNLATALLGQGRQEEALVAARRATEIAPDSVLTWRTFSAVLPYVRAAEEHTAAVRVCARHYPRTPLASLANDPDPERPLRVGLLSNALRTHPVGWLTLAGWEALDRTSFDVICLGLRLPSNPLARRFAARASAWYEATGDDAAVAGLCREIGIDVLVDLGGHGEGGRIGVLAQRAAPVQVKWVGSQAGSSGLPEMDWFLTDRWETPPDTADLYHERLLRLPDGYVCYEPPVYAPDVHQPLPALATGGVTFGCLNNLAKITPEVIVTWSRILAAVPNSRLLIKAPQLDDPRLLSQVGAQLTAAGIAPQRAILRGASSHRAHLAAYATIDIALDPFPYSGGLSTCEAMWMGVPTVTLPGRSFASRHTLSHQENAGLHGWAANSTDDYVSLAIQRASDLSALAALRVGLRAQVAVSPLCDAPRFGRSLGTAFRQAWQAWCEDVRRAGSSA